MGDPTPHFTCESQFQVKERYMAESYIAVVLTFLGFKVQEVSILEAEAH
jgi:hypothetical protein